MNWEECKIKRLVKEVNLDVMLIKSLIEGSNNKLRTNELIPLTDMTASTKTGIAYDYLREILEALALQKGFKIYNHECFTGFLKELLNLEEESFEFDKFRKLRNGLNYYGKKITLEEAKSIINDMYKLKDKLYLIFGGEAKIKWAG